MRIRGGGWAIIPTCCWWEKPWFPSLKPSANITKRLSSLSVSSKALLFIHCYSFTSSSILRLKVSPTCWWLLRGVYVLVLACFGLVWSFILCLVFMFLICMKSHGICLLSLWLIFTYHDTLKVCSCCHNWQDLIPFLQLSSIPCCVYVWHLPYPFICWWAQGCSHILATINNFSTNLDVTHCPSSHLTPHV